MDDNRLDGFLIFQLFIPIVENFFSSSDIKRKEQTRPKASGCNGMQRPAANGRDAEGRRSDESRPVWVEILKRALCMSFLVKSIPK